MSFFGFDSRLVLGLEDKIGNFEVKSVSARLSARYFCKTLISWLLTSLSGR